jgi:group II intron reverse transcriptase/maturase
LRSQTVSIKLQQIANQASNNPKMVFSTLAHHMDVDFLREAYYRTPKKKAPGVDKVTAKEYAENLEPNLINLLETMKSGKYKAPPVKRVWIEKEDKSKRPIGISTFEDKIVQRAVSMLLEAVYEQDFYDFSYGFRPKRNPHQVIKALWEQCTYKGNNINWILDADVSGCFDNIDRELLRQVIKKRINDGGLIRYIGKWLNAGVLENDILSYSDKGTPQGGVISPMLANIFLHDVLDDWYVKEVKPRLKGKSFLLRFADDFIIGFEKEEDAVRVKEVLFKRFARFGLALHPKKTKLTRFGRPKASDTSDKDNGSFDFLAFTHFWAKSLKGGWVIKRKTSKKRLRRAMISLRIWCRNNRHKDVAFQYKMLCLKLKGHYQYYGIISNYRLLEQVFKRTEQSWRYWLSRRSRKSSISWADFDRMRLLLPLPKPRIVHNI